MELMDPAGDAFRFTWDDRKAESNVKKHGIAFGDAIPVFRGRTITMLDTRFDYGEDRFITYGLLRTRVVVIAHTETERLIRIISMRYAEPHEEADYFEGL